MDQFQTAEGTIACVASKDRPVPTILSPILSRLKVLGRCYSIPSRMEETKNGVISTRMVGYVLLDSA